MTKDLVCKMDVDEKKTNFNSEYAGRKYHFCSEQWKDTFDSQPEPTQLPPRKDTNRGLLLDLCGNPFPLRAR